MLRDDLRSLWTEPRAADPPKRVWRDWALLAVGLGWVALEGALREDVGWRPVAVPLAVGLLALTLWRRRYPLAAIALAFGTMMAVEVATLVADPPEPVGLYPMMVVLVLVYALPRWGSGRQIVLGTAVILPAFALSVVADGVTAAEQVLGFGFLLLPGVLGAATRSRATARRRQLERMRSREREQLARELHDTVAHHVSAMVIRAQAGRVVAGTDPAAAVEALEGIEEEGARALEEMRAMVAALRDGGTAGRRDGGTAAELTPRAGVADLERLARPPGGGPRVDLALAGELDVLPPAVDAAIYRIVQESVANAMRHAVDATEIVVRVGGEPERVRVTVRDDGAQTGRGRDGYGVASITFWRPAPRAIEGSACRCRSSSPGGGHRHGPPRPRGRPPSPCSPPPEAGSSPRPSSGAAGWRPSTA